LARLRNRSASGQAAAKARRTRPAVLSTLAGDVAFHQLVDITKLRRTIERDFQELKQ
jgi:hypothetical protein